jgi:hypothetical protein
VHKLSARFAAPTFSSRPRYSTGVLMYRHGYNPELYLLFSFIVWGAMLMLSRGSLVIRTRTMLHWIPCMISLTVKVLRL